jgi:VWFA-related protein
MQEGIARIDSRGGTAMRDAISGGIDYMKKKGKRQKKVLLVITDGNDNASTIKLEKLVSRAQQNEIVLFAIGLLNEEERHEAKIAKRALGTLARETGGLTFYPKGVADVDQIALQVAHEIRNQYTLAYSPTIPQMDGSFRQIKVTVNGPGHPLVRTRTGYYATSDDQRKKTVSEKLPHP